jgi:hypothetical protein
MKYVSYAEAVHLYVYTVALGSFSFLAYTTCPLSKEFKKTECSDRISSNRTISFLCLDSDMLTGSDVVVIGYLLIGRLFVTAATSSLTTVRFVFVRLSRLLRSCLFEHHQEKQN